MWGRGRKVRGFLRLLAGIAAIPAVLLAAFFLLPAFGRVSPEALQYSVTREAGGAFWFYDSDQCRRLARRAWRCRVTGSDGSGGDVYRVVLGERECWKARKVLEGAKIPLPARASGCVGVRDQLRVVIRVVDRTFAEDQGVR